MASAEHKKFIPIGVDDFKNLIEQNYYFVDKSLFIKELLDSRAVATIIPRPRRFGKTLNLSMTRYFFEKTTTSNRHLFHNLAIEQHADCMQHQGNYPVIWLTFKDVKTTSWKECYRRIQMQLKDEFERHSLVKDALSETEKEDFEHIQKGTGDLAYFARSLFNLSKYLARYYNKKVIILIDEYDSPIHEGYLNGYYDEVIAFMREFLGAGLKGNTNVSMSILTGILRIAKESIFSGLNNLRICSLINKPYADKFGFIEGEVNSMLSYFDLEHEISQVRDWYNGYRCGESLVYNPWSIINAIDQQNLKQAYWVNTSENLLIQNLLQKSSFLIKDALENLIRGQTVAALINEHITLAKVELNENVLWNFLLFSGYLTFQNHHLEGNSWYADLKIPNKEITSLYETIVLSWFQEQGVSPDYTFMLNQLTNGYANAFKNAFEKFCYQALSSFDVTGQEPERFYHALVLGMLVALNKTHHVRSNRESGTGRYDVCITPKDDTKPGIIIEFKKIDTKKTDTLEAVAQQALEQINQRDYEAEMRTQGITQIIKLGIAFLGKESFVTIG